MKNLFRRCWEGEGGARLLLQIAFPMIVSQGAETLMMFVDRLFLARLSPVHLAAAMGAGIAMFTMTTFFVGVLGYVNAMVAQYFGVNKMTEAGRAAGQGIIFACLSYPVALILILGVIPLLQYVGHTPEQIVLERQYIQVLAWGTILFLLRTALGSFFSGIGRTRIVMIANLVALIVNIPANYLLIFGKFGCPRLEMAGAAYGTLLGSLSGVAILLCAFFSASNRQRFQTHRNIRFDRKLFARLWYYGSPAGTEFFLNILAFTVFVEFFHAYSRVAAAAVTIVFSWDLIAFLPVTGIGIGVTSLVGRYSGRKDWPSATRSAYIALGVTWIYSLFMTCLFILFPLPLVSMFAKGGDHLEYMEIIPLAVRLLQMAAIYVTSDGAAIVFGSALRGAGDTRWPMRISVTLHWLMAGLCAAMMKLWRCSPVLIWLVFASMIAILALTLFLRFRSKRWQNEGLLDDREFKSRKR